MADDTPNNKVYDARSIRVMEGLEAVRKRPAMYIGSTGAQGLHHLVYEVVDNSVDEALAGYCSEISVILHADKSCSVEDNGRGIPTDIHPTEKISAAEVVLTKLHAGGKFDKDSYKYSGGLHGVGVSVVNALSTWLKVKVFKDGKVHEISFKRGIPDAPLVVTGETKKRGTYVRFLPDPEIFEETTDLSFDVLSARLRELAFLNKGLRITITDEVTNKKHDFLFEGGIVSFVEAINKKKTPLFSEVVYFENSDDKYVLEVAIQYNDGYGEQLFSFVNNINTIDGGTHVSGFKSALTKICNKRAQDLGGLKESESFSSDDVREGLVAVINMKVPEPQFEGQTKGKLGNSEVKGIVDSWSFAYLDKFFEEYPAIGRKILAKAEIAKRAREAAKKARDLTRRKTVLESSVLPGKLADCASEEPSISELFIVEGDSAGGSAKQARDRHTQAILPLRGKILNVEKARVDKILSNEEIKALIAAIGCGISQEFDAEKARYHKIILMTDADVDGSHIRTLLLTFFFRYMQPLIEKGYLYIAQPPLYKATIGKKEQYLKDDSALLAFIFDWAREHAQLRINGALLEDDAWVQLLNNLFAYHAKLEEESHDFSVSMEHCHTLALFAHQQPTLLTESLDALVHGLNKAFEQLGYAVTLTSQTQAQLALDEEGEEIVAEQPALNEQQLVFTKNNRSWSITPAFFASAEIQKLVQLLDPLIHLEGSAGTLSMRERERSLEVASILGMLRALTELSKPYMNIQRYKGLGEMNADQLWETAMDPKVRSILKVKVEDVLEADAWFATLMGDDVKGRRSFIEERGRFVKNLDI